MSENLLLHLSAFTQPAVFADELCDYLSFPNLYEYVFHFHHAHRLFGIAYYFYFEMSYYFLYFKCYLKYQYLIFFEILSLLKDCLKCILKSMFDYSNSAVILICYLSLSIQYVCYIDLFELNLDFFSFFQ